MPIFFGWGECKQSKKWSAHYTDKQKRKLHEPTTKAAGDVWKPKARVSEQARVSWVLVEPPTHVPGK